MHLCQQFLAGVSQSGSSNPFYYLESFTKLEPDGNYWVGTFFLKIFTKGLGQSTFKRTQTGHWLAGAPHLLKDN